MNQNQITMTAGNDRSFSITVDDDYEGDDFAFTVDGLFTKTGIVGADDGSGSSTVTVDVDADDTDGAPDSRRAYRYALEVTHDGDVLTIRRGLFVVNPVLDAVE